MYRIITILETPFNDAETRAGHGTSAFSPATTAPTGTAILLQAISARLKGSLMCQGPAATTQRWHCTLAIHSSTTTTPEGSFSFESSHILSGNSPTFWILGWGFRCRVLHSGAFFSVVSVTAVCTDLPNHGSSYEMDGQKDHRESRGPGSRHGAGTTSSGC